MQEPSAGVVPTNVGAVTLGGMVMFWTSTRNWTGTLLIATVDDAEIKSSTWIAAAYQPRAPLALYVSVQLFWNDNKMKIVYYCEGTR